MASTNDGKAISARNATTHGLFCRQTVLPHLGEDGQGYEKMLMALMEGLDPRTLMERQYLELWADASWKLRRLSRWEAQLWETDALDEDALLTKLERLSRLQTTLRRQLDKAVRMLGGVDVPTLYAQRSRRAILAGKGWTEVDCRRDWSIARDVESEVLADTQHGDSLYGLDKTLLDNEHAPAQAPPQEAHCETLSSDDNENFQNELADAPEEEDEADDTALPAFALPSPDLDQGMTRRERILADTCITGENPFGNNPAPPGPRRLMTW